VGPTAFGVARARNEARGLAFLLWFAVGPTAFGVARARNKARGLAFLLIDPSLLQN